MSENQFVQITRRSKFPEPEFHQMISVLDKKKRLLLRAEPQVPLDDLPAKIAENFVTPADAPVPDCVTCGVCCVYLLCVGIKPTDATPSETYWDVVDTFGDAEVVVDRFMRRSDGDDTRCASLGGTLGVQVGCTVYEHRPKVCRQFDAGSDKCHALRRAYGIEQPLSETAVAVALKGLAELEERELAKNKIYYAKILPQPGSDNLMIIALMEDESQNFLHIFDPAKETYMQVEFSGLTMDEARELINSRSAING